MSTCSKVPFRHFLIKLVMAGLYNHGRRLKLAVLKTFLRESHRSQPFPKLYGLVWKRVQVLVLGLGSSFDFRVEPSPTLKKKRF